MNYQLYNWCRISSINSSIYIPWNESTWVPLTRTPILQVIHSVTQVGGHPTIPNRSRFRRIARCSYYSSRWWFHPYFLFSPLFGEDEPILTSAYFSIGLVKNHHLAHVHFLTGFQSWLSCFFWDFFPHKTCEWVSLSTLTLGYFNPIYESWRFTQKLRCCGDFFEYTTVSGRKIWSQGCIGVIPASPKMGVASQGTIVQISSSFVQDSACCNCLACEVTSCQCVFFLRF